MGSPSVDVVRGVYESLARGNLTAVLAAMADGVEWHEAEGMPYGGVHRGPQTVVEKVLVPIVADVEGFSGPPAGSVGHSCGGAAG